MRYVLDTSAIVSRRFNLAGEDVLVPPSVIDEIRKGRLKSMLDSLEGIIRVVSPAQEFISEAREKAGESGDADELSPTDVDVIALAKETGSTVVSDDFAIQNVCSLLGIEYMGADLSEIKQEVLWKYRCTGCKKTYGTAVGTCRVCGHEVVRTRAGSRIRSSRQKR